MTRDRRSVLKGIGAGTAAVVGITGTATASNHEAGDAEVRVIHASPDAPAVDVFVDGSAVLEDVTFTTVSDYLSVAAGSYDVAVAPAGAGVGSAVIETSLPVEAGTDYTVAAANRLADIEPVVFVDDNEADSGLSRLRIVHLSPDAPAVDIVQTDGPGVGGGENIVVSDLSYQDASGYLDLPPADYEFEVRAAGTDQSVATVPLDPEPGATYTAFAVGLLSPDDDSQAFDVVASEDVAPVTERTGSGRGNGNGGNGRGRGNGNGGNGRGRGNGR